MESTPATDRFSWPYPRNPDQLVRLVMLCLVLLLIGLAITAARYDAYRTQVLDGGTIQQTAKSLANAAQAADMVTQQALQQRDDQRFRAAYADDLQRQVKDMVSYVASRKTAPDYKNQAATVVATGQQLYHVLDRLGQSDSGTELQQADRRLRILQQQLQPLEGQ